LRGQGRVLLSLPGALRSVVVLEGEPVSVPLSHLVGWQGTVSPQVRALLENPGPGLPDAVVELSGEGFALIALPVR
ncbi:MAG TPA: AIM24 family protein, partial [Archangium sp.]